MSNEIDQFEIVEEGLGPLPKGAPSDLRERLTLHLRTTDGETLAEAERDFQGRFASVDDGVLVFASARAGTARGRR